MNGPLVFTQIYLYYLLSDDTRCQNATLGTFLVVKILSVEKVLIVDDEEQDADVECVFGSQRLQRHGIIGAKLKQVCAQTITKCWYWSKTQTSMCSNNYKVLVLDAVRQCNAGTCSLFKWCACLAALSVGYKCL